MMDELIEEMIDPAPSREDVARRRRAWATGTILVLAGVGATSLTTAAVFTDADTVAGRSVGTGTLVLEAGTVEFDVPAEGMAPGDTVVARLDVDNEGSLELRYAVSFSAATTAGAGDLREQLRLRVLDDETCTVASAAQAPELGAYPAEPGTFGLPGPRTAVVGDPAPGRQAGDRVLGALTETETLCLELHLSRDAGNDLQGASAALTVELDSEQTVNN